MKISLAITTFNRYDLTIKSCAHVLDDPRIDDIVILDDKSTDGSFEKLVEYYKPYPHVRVIQQVVNRRMQQNKADAISFAGNEWVILLDSDNIIDKSYIDAAMECSFYPDTIYCPQFARPNFDFTSIAGHTISVNNVGNILGGRYGDTLNVSLNCCNYMVPRDNYLKVYEPNDKMKATETVWFAYLWLKAGNRFNIVPGMEYQHLIHSGSGFMEDASYNMKQSEKIKKMIMAL